MLRPSYAVYWRSFIGAVRKDMCIAVLPVLCAYLVAVNYLIETDSKLLLRGCYVLSAGVIILAALSPWFRRKVIPGYRHDWGALLLGLFCVHLLFQALTYPDWSVSENYLKIWVIQIVTGAGLGFLSLSLFIRSGIDASSRRALGGAYQVVIAISIAALVYVSWRLYLRRAEDSFFIISNTDSVYYYQIFGNYAIVLYGSIAMILRRAISSKVAIRALIYRNAAQSIFTLWLFFLVQLVGSNNAAVVIVAIGALTFIGDTIKYFRETAGRWRWLGSLSLSGEGLVVLLVAATIIANLPPIRLFGYKPAPYLSALSTVPAPERVDTGPPSLTDSSLGLEGILEDSSVTSRSEILVTYGMAQLSVDPVFGDLGAEIVTGTPSKYLHSLLSIQTHLGIVGSLLMIGFLASRVRSFVKGMHDTVVIAFIAVTFIVAALATFFSWLPFWFAIGLLLAMPTRAQLRLFSESRTAGQGG